jgi:bifunctional DNase/RNase
MSAHREDFILMMVGGITIDPSTKMPIVVLKDPDNKLNLPIWIGPLEATAMATELEGIKPQRPMTHDLLRNLLTEFGATVESAEITELRDNTYFARIQLKSREGRAFEIDSRPSDAIALAIANLRREESPRGVQRVARIAGRAAAAGVGAKSRRRLARQVVRNSRTDGARRFQVQDVGA